MAPELTMLHVVEGSHIGYGRMGVYIVKELREQGYTVYDSIADHTGGRAGVDIERVQIGGVTFGDGHRTEGLTNVVCWAAPPPHAMGWWPGQVPCVLTMWEATELPPAFRENLDEFDTVMVPSWHNVELFRRYHDNVHYVPLGIDPERWFPVKRRPPTTRFNFLIGGTGERKGTDLAVRAFQKAFPPGSWGRDQPIPYLVMKQPKDEGYHGDRIEHILGYVDGEVERSIYEEAHCYLQPSRGEGFGLQPLQAIAQAIPTILTNAHGHFAFSHLGMGLSFKMSRAGFFLYGDAGYWWEPDFDELVDSMRYVYEHYDECSQRAWELAPKVVEEGLTWAAAANRFADAIGRGRFYEPAIVGDTWHRPTARLYPVVLLHDHACDIGGTRWVFEKGVERFVPADVKRIFFEGGHLDPVCLEGDDIGLHPDQVARLPEYLERHAYCPTCQQKLGTGVMKGTV